MLRVQAESNAGGGGVNDGTLSQLLQARYNRQETNDIDYRVRGAISWDVRQQTEYGTLRTYIRTGVNQSTPADGIGGAVFWDRAFIQFAGFTVGKAQSFFDTVTYGGAYTYHNVRTVSDTGASGWNVWAYTAQFGNGFSGTLSLGGPQPQPERLVTTRCTGFLPTAPRPSTTPSARRRRANNGMRMPDVIGNLRLDQAWGYASVSVAVHDVAGAYYGSPMAVPRCAVNCVNNGHPADKKGWAIGAGALFNIPGGHKLGINAQWSEGASGYGSATGQIWTILQPGTSVGFGYQADGIFTTGGEIELTRVWNVIAFYEHVWNKNWKTSFFGGYVQTEYNTTARNLINSRTLNAAVCGVAQAARHQHGVRFLERQQLRSGLQLLPGRCPHPVEPGGAARYRPRSDVHQAQYRLSRPGCG